MHNKNCAPILLAVALLCTASSVAAENADPSELQRLAANLSEEPLALIGVQDVQAFPAKLSKTQLAAMYNDPNYANGAKTLQGLVNESLGKQGAEFWNSVRRLATGPALLALTTSGTDAAPEIHPALLLVASSESGASELTNVFAKGANESPLSSLMKLKILTPKGLDSVQKLPDWVQRPGFNGDAVLSAASHKLAVVIKRALAAGSIPGLDKESLGELKLPEAIDAYSPEIERLTLRLNFSDDVFADELSIQLKPNSENSLSSLVMAIREKPHAWDALFGAVPAGEDLTLLAQTDPSALGTNLPNLAQAIERNLRGHRWTRQNLKSSIALDPKRFQFIFDLLAGDLAIAAHPSITGEVRVTVAAALTNREPDAARHAMIDGFKSVGEDFQTNEAGPKIGECAPVRAMFQRRGAFSSPVIGLSPGWAWLCSNPSAYQEFTSAFNNSKTQKSTNGDAPENIWRENDALRMQANLEKVASLGYTIWMLSGQDGPAIGTWHIPTELFPSPPVMQGHMGSLRASINRNASVLNVNSRCALPGTSLILLELIQQASGMIDEVKKAPALDNQTAPK